MPNSYKYTERKSKLIFNIYRYHFNNLLCLHFEKVVLYILQVLNITKKHKVVIKISSLVY